MGSHLKQFDRYQVLIVFPVSIPYRLPLKYQQQSTLPLILKLSNRNLEFSSLQIFKVEGSLKFHTEELGLAHTQYVGSVGPNFVGVKNGIFFKMYA